MMNNIAKAVLAIDEMLAVQKKSISYGDKEFDYMQGLYNGMEFARSLVAGQAPLFLDKYGELDPLEVAQSPERFI